MDAMGHVNNTVYFRYMEQTRIEWFYEFAKKIDTKPYVEQGPIIINASCTFLEPLVYPGDLEVKMFLGELGRSSFGSHYEIWMNAKKYAEGAAKELLTAAFSVDVRGVEEVDAGSDGGIHDFSRDLVIDSPPEVITPKADDRDL